LNLRPPPPKRIGERAADLMYLDQQAIAGELATILLPDGSVRRRIGQHLAKAPLENEQPIETYWYGVVREVIAVAESRRRCTSQH
jgi:hypothetical protein